MFGGELLVALAQGQRLRGLHETAGAVGVFLDIHASTPSACPDRPEGTARNIVIELGGGPGAGGGAGGVCARFPF